MCIYFLFITYSSLKKLIFLWEWGVVYFASIFIIPIGFIGALVTASVASTRRNGHLSLPFIRTFGRDCPVESVARAVTNASAPSITVAVAVAVASTGLRSLLLSAELLDEVFPQLALSFGSLHVITDCRDFCRIPETLPLFDVRGAVCLDELSVGGGNVRVPAGEVDAIKDKPSDGPLVANVPESVVHGA